MTLPPLTANAWLRWDVVARLLDPVPGTVLEVGCGQGGVGVRLAGVADHYLGVEPDAASAETACRRLDRLGRGRVVQGLVDDVLPAEARFDLVCAFEVLEHIEDDRAALRAWAARVRPGGRLLVSTPAFAARFGPSDEMVGHFRRYEPSQLAALLEESGLDDAQVVVYGAPLGFALEAARNVIGRRRLARRPGPGDRHWEPSRADLTSTSGRLFQPSVGLGVLTRAATAPFRRVQRAFPQRGTGLVAVASRPQEVTQGYASAQ